MCSDAHYNNFIKTLIFLSCVLLPAFGQTGKVTIRSQPSGALVRIDDEDIGSTPIVEYIVKAGSHNIQLTDPNTSKTVDQAIQIDADSTISLYIPLDVPHGFLSVKSRPKGANVSLHTKLGSTPLSNARLISGDYTMRVEHPNSLYKPVDTPVTIPVNLNKPVELTLPKNPQYIAKMGVQILLGLAGIGAYGWGCSSYAHKNEGAGLAGFCLGTACIVSIEVFSLF
jgi:hypothetical protein